jgi:hypothetical protein
MKNKKDKVSAKLVTVSATAGAAVFGVTTTAQAALNVFDHRDAPLVVNEDYWVFDQTMAVLNVVNGDFDYVAFEQGTRTNQDGTTAYSAIPESAKTSDTVWFSHRDMLIDGKGADGVMLETPAGGAGGGTLSAYNDQILTPTGTHEWFYADQAGTALGMPVDGPATQQVDGSLSYNDASPTDYTGVNTHGFGGYGHGSGWSWGVYGPDGANVTVPFKLQQFDGTHYGWVAVRHNEDRNRIWIYGWGYQTLPNTAAELTWEASGPVSRTGDFDGDGDIDADDIDALGAAIAASSTDPDFDMDGDGDVDADDFAFHVHNLVDTALGEGTGTEFGDFNLDGTVGILDLGLLGDNYATSAGWALGDANGDGSVGILDLGLLGDNYGFDGSAIPEPMTMSLLAMGAVGVLARRKK